MSAGRLGAGTGEFDHERFLRDLTSLLALPSFWSGTEPAFVLRTFFEALETLLGLRVCYGAVPGVSGDRIELLRINGRITSVDDPVAPALMAFALAEPAAESGRTIDLDGRAVTCIRLPIGYVWETGRIVVGAARPSFPDPTELVTLRAAMSLAASGLETARIIRERDEAQRAKDEFLAMLGHELRNPLAPIVTALQLMARQAGAEKSREQLIIERQVRHLRRLVDDLLDVSRIARGKIELQVASVDLADVAARALETVMPAIEQAGHQVEVQVPAGLIVDGDVLRLTQVVANLLNNAAKYTPAGGRLQLTGDTEGAMAQLRVIDNGTGLPPELVPKIFDLFVQGGRNLARQEGGLGIGLALVKQIVVAHGGSVSAHSDGSGRGSVFTVRLPLAVDRRDGSGVAAPELEGPAPATASHVLIVDDNRDSADLAALVLTGAGHRVDVAYSGHEALAHAARHAPEVVVLDIGLPDLDGYQVAAELQVRLADRPPRIIALTGYGQPHDRERSAAAGFAAHLVKPVDPTELRRVVER